MARRGTGRWVERAAATGGGRTYRGQTPVRFYASLVIICVVGVGLLFYSRYERQHPAGATQPAVGTHWYAALAFDVCGKLQPNLAANPPARVKTGLNTQGDGIIHVSPVSKAESGSNATLGRFVQGYRGLQLTSGVLRLPGSGTYRSGGTCPAGTADAGKHASVQVRMWPSVSGKGSQQPVAVGDPSGLKLANGQLITAAFVPDGRSIPKPAGSTIVTLLGLVSGQSPTTPGAPTTPTPTPGAPTTPTPTPGAPVTPTPTPTPGAPVTPTPAAP